jgi:nucleotide-binding universal stress UspA family protein
VLYWQSNAALRLSSYRSSPTPVRCYCPKWRFEEDFQEILSEGVARLRSLGFDPVAELVRGQPAEEIGKFARQVGADLIVVGHRRQSALDRWGSGPKGAYLMDYTDCSLLVARNVVSDEAIEALRVDR